MEFKTISQVSKTYDISSRMLRYYEQAGLIKSIRNEENSYRYYDDSALKRVQQIIILRRLQIPVKQICVIMNNPSGECQKGEDKHCVGCGNCGSSPEKFEYDIKTDGRLDILNKYRKPGAPVLVFGSHDMDSQMRGGWRSSYCLMESDITNVQAFMEHNPYIRTVDAAKWLIFECARGGSFDAHSI